MDVVGANGFQLYLKRGVLPVNEEEVILYRRHEEVVQMDPAEKTVIPERCEVVAQARLTDGADRGSIMIFEPRMDDEQIGHGIAIGKGLIRADDMIPVRLLNAKGFPVHLKKHWANVRRYIVRSVGASDETPSRLHEKL